MIKGLMDWIDDRSGIRGLVKEALYEKVPGGARWRYVWGSCLTFVFFTQVVTGTLLWMFYAPSAQTAWESVYFLQYHVAGGWFLRGVHHYMAQAMIVLLVLHLMQVVIDGAYKAPRELNFWFGILMMGVTLALSLTGYLLPWDQKGYWATAVATNLMAEVPLIGPALQKIVVGGSEYGHHTLTRFFALHAGVLPASLVALVVAHIYLFRKHGIHVKEPRPKRDSYFWPDQVLKDAIACLAVLLAVVALTIYFRGAPLGPPADPSNEFPARPEWYFLFLFQLLNTYLHSGEPSSFPHSLVSGCFSLRLSEIAKADINSMSVSGGC
jgi:ubiquinol-cytochrome c reductase cytochrome b subunit